jgi:hypothetical protein
MDARIMLSQDLFNLASVRAWQSYRSRQQSSRLLVDELAGVGAVAEIDCDLVEWNYGE